MKKRSFLAALMAFCLVVLQIPVFAAETTPESLDVGESVTVAAGETKTYTITPSESGDYKIYTADGADDSLFFWDYGGGINLYYADDRAEIEREYMESDWEMGGYNGREWVLTAGTEYLLEIYNESDSAYTFYWQKECAPESVEFDWEDVKVECLSEDNTVIEIGLWEYKVTPVYAEYYPVSTTLTASDSSVVTIQRSEDSRNSYNVEMLKTGEVKLSATATFSDGKIFSDTSILRIKEKETIELGKEYTITNQDTNYHFLPDTLGCNGIYKINRAITSDSSDYMFSMMVTSNFKGYFLTENKDGIIEDRTSLYADTKDCIMLGRPQNGPNADDADILITSRAENGATGSTTYQFLPAHTLTKTEAKAATYEAEGNITYYTCADCGAITSDELGCKKITLADTVIPKLEKAVEVPVEDMKDASESGKDFTVESADATVTFDNKALESVLKDAGEEASITLEVSKIQENELNAVQKESVADKKIALVFSAELLVNNEPVASETEGGFGGGKVTVQIPFVPEAGTEGDDYVVYYIADDGKITEVPTSYVDGHLVVELEHLSEYAVVYTGEEDGGNTPDENIPGGNTPDENTPGENTPGGSTSDENVSDENVSDGNVSKVTPKTGDTANITLLLAVAMMSLAVVCVIINRRKA